MICACCRSARRTRVSEVNTRKHGQFTGAVVVGVFALTVGPFAQAAQENGGRAHAPGETLGLTLLDITEAVSGAFEEAHEEQAKRDHAELQERFAMVRARIAALPSLDCGLSVPWNEYTGRFAAILARVDDTLDPLQAAEREHAMAGLNELDRFISSAMTYDADVCAARQELAALEEEARRHRAAARSRLVSVADAFVCRPTAADRAALTVVVNRHRPADEQVRAVYDPAASDLLDQIGKLHRSGALCNSAAAGSLVKKLPDMVVDSHHAYHDPVGVKTAEHAGTRALLQARLDAKGKHWLGRFTVPPATDGGDAEAGQE